MLASATSMESLNAIPDLRRASASRSSQSSAFAFDALLEEDGIGIASSPNSSTSPCVPTVVMMCIRHLEQFGLHTVGIFSGPNFKIGAMDKVVQSFKVGRELFRAEPAKARIEYLSYLLLVYSSFFVEIQGWLEIYLDTNHK